MSTSKSGSQRYDVYGAGRVPYYTGYRSRSSSASSARRQKQRLSGKRYAAKPKLLSPCAGIPFDQCGNVGCKPVIRFRRTASGNPEPYCKSYPKTLTNFDDLSVWANTGYNRMGDQTPDWYTQQYYGLPQRIQEQADLTEDIDVPQLHQRGRRAGEELANQARRVLMEKAARGGSKQYI